MKKMMFLMLTLLIWGAASMNAQVRIGGSDVPYGAAVLDLNANDSDNPDGNLGLALPRLNLTPSTLTLGGKTPKDGTLVYNTALDSTGIYVWTTDKWVKLLGGDDPVLGTRSVPADSGKIVRSDGQKLELVYEGIRLDGADRDTCTRNTIIT